MSSPSDESSNDSLLRSIVDRISSEFLLFCIVICLLIIAILKVANVDVALPIGAVLLVFLVGTWVYSRNQSPKAEVKAAFKEVPDSKSEKLGVDVWVKHVNGAVSDVFRLGDQVRVCVKATRECYLTLLNLASDGELTILFPNRHNQNNRIQGGMTHEIPSDGYGFNIILEEPVGIESVKAIVTLDPKPLLKTQFNEDGDFFKSVAPTATPRAMRVVAAEVKKLDNENWAAASAKFEVSK
ncbi:DUF4384 domain-containing protein [Pelagicoccus albus]|uniref:DUF4384 domain-containing protein n=1 Tax=Pelagicoccus albus TaxID=415222 RepID=A0A7X1B7J0_9BACT|nr:DUF4384 domain-containing protein [Pelagicoccus albus]MBC2605835.1 DUF4384 domain-containing protein [Pelagicoccus albus]